MVVEHATNPTTVSVIISAYNASDTVGAAIESVVSQEFRDWELIICDDASTDATWDEICKHVRSHMHKVQLLRNTENLGLAASLNRCLGLASGRYIARMDADDISRADRFSQQVSYLDANPECDLVGTAMHRFEVLHDGTVAFGGIVQPVAVPDRKVLLRRAPFSHATIMARRRVFDELRGYTVAKRTRRTEDVDLWFRFFSKGFVGRNLPDTLYYVREDLAAIKRRDLATRVGLYQTQIVGYRLLQVPLYWYVFPHLDLIKAIIPARLMRVFRGLQARRATR